MRALTPYDLLRSRATKYAVAFSRMRVAEAQGQSAMSLIELDRELYEARSLFLQAVAVVEARGWTCVNERAPAGREPDGGEATETGGSGVVATDNLQGDER